MDNSNIDRLFSELSDGKRNALAKLITILEQSDLPSSYLKSTLDSSQYCCNSIGITGPAGVGKSTIINHLIELFVQNNKRVGVLAYDPSSPFTGGSLLGDRIRMQSHSTSKNVYIRSFSSDSGIPDIAPYIIKLYGLYGVDIAILETVGAGQNDVGVFNVCDLTVVVLIPELGDTIQVLKAGLLEIADIFVINKSDICTPDLLEMDLKLYIERGGHIRNQPPKIVKTSDKNNSGFKELYNALNDLIWSQD